MHVILSFTCMLFATYVLSNDVKKYGQQSQKVDIVKKSLRVKSNMSIRLQNIAKEWDDQQRELGNLKKMMTKIQRQINDNKCKGGTKECCSLGNRYVKNVAFRKNTKNTSQYDINHSRIHATNGNLNDVFATKLESNPAIRIDLRRMYRVFEVEIYNRKTAAYAARFRDVDIKVGRTLSDLKLCGHYNGPARQSERVIVRCSKVMTGRFVELKITKHRTYMNFNEVMVWGTEI